MDFRQDSADVGDGYERSMEMRGMNRTVFGIFFVLLGCVFFGATTFAETGGIRLDARGMDPDARLVNLRLDPAKNVIALDDAELIEDDAPATGVPQGMGYDGKEWMENLRKGIVIKKLLMLDNPSAFSGRLVFKGIEMKNNTVPLNISLNGVRFLRPATIYAAPFAKQFIDYSPNDRWFYLDLPVGALRAGENEVLMWAESDSTSWRVLIALEKEFARGSLTRTHHPNRSMKSSDGGATWSDSKLGPLNSVDGEYSIRFSLDRFVKAGEYVSPVMDVTGEKSVLKRSIRFKSMKLSVGIDTPEGAKADVLVRFGASPREDDPSWTAWGKAESGGEYNDLGNRRYVQWKAALSTTNPLATPKIRSFVLDSVWEEASPNRDLGVSATVAHNGHVARSSIPFGYENLMHPELEKFRKNARLDKIVEGAGSEFEVMMRLLNWAYRIPVTNDQYSWNWNDVVKIEKGEKGMPRLQTDYKGRRRDAMCLYSNQALVGALLSLGYQARHINIHSEAISGHEVTEVWSNEFDKWIYMDATRDYYYFDPATGLPLNLMEIHNRMAALVPRVETWQRPFVPEAGPEVAAKVPVGIREGANPFSSVADGRHILEIIGHFRIIPRNDFLSNPLPVPVHTGATMWGWDGFLNWYDDIFPKRWEYQRYSNRPLDFYEPLNQSEVVLSETADRGVLRVDVATFTPGFDACVVSIDGGAWVSKKELFWTWPLRAGKNRIEVRTRNVRGILGPVSALDVTFNP